MPLWRPHVPRHTSPIQLSSPPPGPCPPDPPHAKLAPPASHRLSFPAILELPEHATPAVHDSATPSRKPFLTLCGVEPAPPAKPKLPVFASVCVRENLACVRLSSFAVRVGNTTSFLGSVRRCTVGHHGRHVAPTSEFHEGVRPAQEVRQPSPERGPCTVALLDFCDAWMKRRAFLRHLVRQLVRLQLSQ